jgi:hypothetical protein
MPSRDHGKHVLGCAGAALLALTAACAGPRSVPPSASPTSHSGQLPAGLTSGKTKYATILGPVTGSGSKAFTVPVRSADILWLGCLGKGGFAVVKSPALGLDTKVPCGSSGRVSGYQFNVAAASPGQKATVRLTAPQAATWQLLLDAGGKAS